MSYGPVLSKNTARKLHTPWAGAYNPEPLLLPRGLWQSAQCGTGLLLLKNRK